MSAGATPPRPATWRLPLILLAALAAASAAGSLFLFATSEPEYPSVHDTQYISGQSKNFLTPDQIRTYGDNYLALALWAEAAHEAAEHDPLALHAHLQMPLPLQCKHLPRQDLLGCAAQAAADTPPTVPWHQMTPAARLHQANSYLSLLWRATDHTQHFRMNILVQEGVDPVDVPSIQELLQAYQPCADRTVNRGPLLASAVTPTDLAIQWKTAAAAAKNCANDVSTAIFVRGAGSKSSPLETPTPNPPPEDNANDQQQPQPNRTTTNPSQEGSQP